MDEFDPEFEELNDENVMLQEELLDCLSKLDEAICPPVCYADRRKIDAEKLRRDLHATMVDLTSLRKHVNSEALTKEEQYIKDLEDHIKHKHKCRDLIDREMNLLNDKLAEASDCEDYKDELAIKLQKEVNSLRKEKRELTRALTSVENALRERHATHLDVEPSKKTDINPLRNSLTRSGFFEDKLKASARRDVNTAETAATSASFGMRQRPTYRVALNYHTFVSTLNQNERDVSRLSSVVERQSCKLEVVSSILAVGSFSNGDVLRSAKVYPVYAILFNASMYKL